MGEEMCGHCSKRVTTRVERRGEVLPVRGENVEVEADVAVCVECGEDVFVEELDDRTLKAAFAEYRRRHGLLAPEEIVAIRKRYELGQRPFSLLLGWGEVTLHRYESGSLQDDAHDAQLRMTENAANMRVLLQKNGPKLTPRQRARLETRLLELERSGAPERDSGPPAGAPKLAGTGRDVPPYSEAELEQTRQAVAGSRRLMWQAAQVVARAVPKRTYSVDIVGDFAIKVSESCENLFLGVIALMDKGMPENAAVLSRPLFEQSLWLREVAALSEAARQEHAFGWWHDGALESKHLHVATARYDSSTPEYHVQADQAYADGFVREAERRGIRLRKLPSTKDLAKKHGCMVDFTRYLWAHQFVHGSLVTHQVRAAIPTQLRLLDRTGSAAPELEYEITMFAIRSVLRAAEAACVLLKLPPDPKFSQVFDATNPIPERENEE